MSEPKTQKTDASVEDYLSSITNLDRQADVREVCQMMTDITQQEPQMWGESIVAFGDKSFTYASGKEGNWFPVGFSSRQAAITLYLMGGEGTEDELLSRLGKHSTGKACLYIKKLDDIDKDVLAELIARTYSDGQE